MFFCHPLQHCSPIKALKITKHKRQLAAMAGAEHGIRPISKLKHPRLPTSSVCVLRPLSRRGTKDFFTQLLTGRITLGARKRGHLIAGIA